MQVLPLARVDAARLARTAQALFVLSTLVMANLRMRGAARRLLAQAPDLSGLQFGLLALVTASTRIIAALAANSMAGCWATGHVRCPSASIMPLRYRRCASGSNISAR